MFRRVEQIKIDGEKPGEAFGGKIFNLSVSVGGEGTPSKVEMDVISENGIYSIEKSSLTAIDPVKIQIGEEDTGLTFKKMYLISYNISQNTDDKVLHLSYWDHSIIFNKIFVGILNEDGNPNTPLADGENAPIRQDIQLERALNFQIPVQCTPCSSLDTRIDPVTGLLPAKLVNITHTGDSGWITNVHPTKGGVILLGTEEYKGNPCTLGDMKYSFNELIYVLEKIGITIKKDPDTNLPSLTNRGKPHRREKFAGKLSDVLSQWCGMYGYSWSYDWETDSIEGIDLLNPNADIENVKNRIKNLNKDSNVICTQMTESATLEGTYHQESHSYFRKDTQLKDNSNQKFSPAFWSNIQLYDIFDNTFWGGSRTNREFLRSAALMRYNSDLRRLYNWMMVMRRAEEEGENESITDLEMGSLEHLGINAYHKLSTEESSELLDMDKGIGDLNASFPNYSEVYGHESDVYFVNYSEELMQRWENWESTAADFIGSFYRTGKPGLAYDQCHSRYLAQRQIMAKPNSQEYSMASKTDVPFKSLLKMHPNGAVSTVGQVDFVLTESDGNFSFVGEGQYLEKGASYAWDQSDPSNTTKFQLYSDPQLNNPINEMQSHGKLGQDGSKQIWLVDEKTELTQVYYKSTTTGYIGDILLPNGVGVMFIVDSAAHIQQKIFIHNRQASWGTSKNVIDQMLSDEATGASKIKPYIPQYQPIAGWAYGTLMVKLKENDKLRSLEDAAKKNQEEEYETCVVVLPKLEQLEKIFQVGEIKGSVLDGEGGAINTEEIVIKSVKKQEKLKPEDACAALACNTDIIKENCRCFAGRDFKVEPNWTGLLSRKARYFTVSVDGETKQIIFPCEGVLKGHYIINEIVKSYNLAIEKHWGHYTNAGAALEYIANSNNITNMLEELEEPAKGEGRPASKSTNIGKEDNLPGNPSGGKAIEKELIVFNNDWVDGQAITAMSGKQYHELTEVNAASISPSETFAFNIKGLDYSEIKEFLNPKNGLEGFSITYTAEGVETSLTFSSGRKRMEMIKLQKELSQSTIEKRISLNRFGRTF